jgi:hypothetical protein
MPNLMPANIIWLVARRSDDLVVDYVDGAEHLGHLPCGSVANLAFVARASANALQPRNTELALVSSSVAVCALTSAQSIKRIAAAIVVRIKIASCDAMAYRLVALTSCCPLAVLGLI